MLGQFVGQPLTLWKLKIYKCLTVYTNLKSNYLNNKKMIWIPVFSFQYGFPIQMYPPNLTKINLSSLKNCNLVDCAFLR